jgi:hypothetical protein
MGKKLAYIFFLFVFTFLILESGTRLLDIKPGYIKNFQDFHLVDSLELFELYKLDERGIYSINVSLFDSLKPYDIQDYPQFVYRENVMEVYEDFNKLENTLSRDTSYLAEAYRKCDDSLFCAVLSQYIQEPINANGFRSIPFVNYQSTRKKVLLLGDSFVYGLSARPTYYSYADILLSKGYLVYNTGINGTDPAQYAAVLEKYLDIIEPDVVILNFSSASDFMPFQRTAKPGEPHEHQMNVGFVESNPLGKYMSAKECFDYYKAFVQIPESSFWHAIAKRSTAVSFIYGRAVDIGFIKHPIQSEYYELRENLSGPAMALNTKVHVEEMNKLAQEKVVPLLNVIIPVKPEFRYSDKNYNEYFVDEDLLKISFADYTYFYPKNLVLEDYAEGFHFNNKGSLKFANFLDDLITETLYD